MRDDGEIEDDERPSGEAEGEQEPLPDRPYDPLTDPWNDPASASIGEYRPPQRQEESALHPGGVPRYPARPYSRADQLTELRDRLREGTVVVPKRANRGSAVGLMVAGIVLLAVSAPGSLAGAAAPTGAAYYIDLGATIAGVWLLLYGISGLVWAVPMPSTQLEREAAETAILALLIFLAVQTSMQNFRVEGASMEPSLDNQEYLVVNKLAYAELDLGIFNWLPFFDSGDSPVHHLWDSPDRGDVIVFRSPRNVDRDFIKRIIGVPGDVVAIDRQTGAVMVNGEIIDEPYIGGNTTCLGSCGPWVVPERAYFVMGDNRQNSSDSRQGWFVPEENIIGKALLTYWHDGSPDLDLAPNHKVSFISEAAAEE